MHSLLSKRYRGVLRLKTPPIFVVLDAREMGREQKQGGGGRREEAKVTLARKPHDFAKRVRPRTQSSDWCGWNRCPSTSCQHVL